ncbi:DUF736 family protein [Rhizobium leguminosarum bv. viciae]|nr:DUF736 domain-containing protein [Rhizobium leguminosarum]MVO92665.1 DUF736 family protein [Rhizobium leguminosarum bv. phaseoli]NKK02932.1 DUF736 family protein [Rhizobium leguminosarum bv. viciae]NKK86866.1 DUF736 family protein [Rhizobium leguminosarum bv. viciae]
MLLCGLFRCRPTVTDPCDSHRGREGRFSESDRDYLSVKLDDPSFPAPIYATLSELRRGWLQLIWSCPNRD